MKKTRDGLVCNGNTNGPWDLQIPVQVPEIETFFMFIDEIARIFSKSQSLHIGGEFVILHISSYFLHNSCIYLHIFFIFLHIAFIFLHISFIFPEVFGHGRILKFPKSYGLYRGGEFGIFPSPCRGP